MQHVLWVFDLGVLAGTWVSLRFAMVAATVVVLAGTSVQPCGRCVLQLQLESLPPRRNCVAVAFNGCTSLQRLAGTSSLAVGCSLRGLLVVRHATRSIRCSAAWQTSGVS
jgi:hypothetical protein